MKVFSLNFQAPQHIDSTTVGFYLYFIESTECSKQYHKLRPFYNKHKEDKVNGVLPSDLRHLR